MKRKDDVINEIADSSFCEILKRFTFKKEYLSRLERVNVIDLEPIFIAISKPFTFIMSALWFFIVTVTFPITFLPMEYHCWKKARRMAKCIKARAVNE